MLHRILIRTEEHLTRWSDLTLIGYCLRSFCFLWGILYLNRVGIKSNDCGTQGETLCQRYAHALIPLGDDEKAPEDEKEKEGGKGKGGSETFVSALCRSVG